MAHFAEIDENNIVQRVIVVANRDTMSNSGVEDESIGEAFCQSLFGENTRWKKTSYTGSMRARFAAAGDTYDAERDAFIPGRPVDRDRWTNAADLPAGGGAPAVTSTAPGCEVCGGSPPSRQTPARA